MYPQLKCQIGGLGEGRKGQVILILGAIDYAEKGKGLHHVSVPFGIFGI